MAVFSAVNHLLFSVPLFLRIHNFKLIFASTRIHAVFTLNSDVLDTLTFARFWNCDAYHSQILAKTKSVTDI